MTMTMTMATMMKMMMAMLMSEVVWGHGMMMQPIQRSSMYRDRSRFPTAKPNWDDDGLYCGGISVQWDRNHGKCGPCGDAYNLPRPRPNEAGGKYGQGIIVETYAQGQMIDVLIRLTANHWGNFVWKLCPNNDVHTPVEQSCLDQHVLKSVGPDGNLVDKYPLRDHNTGQRHIQVQLPPDVTCDQCVLQWTYTAGNNWDCFGNGTCCQGCGPQETFVNCADIAIHSGSVLG